MRASVRSSVVGIVSLAIGALFAGCERRYPEPTYGDGGASAPAGTASAAGMSGAASGPAFGGAAPAAGAAASDVRR